MATLDECAAALERLAGRLAEVDAALRDQHVPARSVSCAVPDLPAVFTAALRDGLLHDVTLVPGAVVDGESQLRLTVASDDLLALTTGELGVLPAWLTGRLRIDASVTDLIRLRALL